MKISLREIFLILIIAALGIAWGVDRKHLADQREQLKISELKLRVRYDEAEVFRLKLKDLYDTLKEKGISDEFIEKLYTPF